MDEKKLEKLRQDYKKQEEKQEEELERKLNEPEKDRSGIPLAILGFVLASWAIRTATIYDINPAMIITMVVGIALLLRGCYTWVKRKNRNILWMFMGLLAPIGFIVLVMLQPKEKGQIAQ